MSYYWDERFIRHLENETIEYVCEVGARYGDESIMLSNVFNSAQIYSFECNPNTINKCAETLKNHPKIKFFAHGLGEKEELLPFYSYTEDNDGASSLHKRIDFDKTQKLSGNVLIKKLDSVMIQENIPHIDLLCMDIQGHELSVLKGSGDFLKNIKYVIMEEPKPVINTTFLPEGVHSKYLNTPTSAEIKQFMIESGFIEIERIDENFIEDNVMYKRKTNAKKRLFNIDLHISVIADIKDIFSRVRPDIEIVDWSLSGHAWVFNKEPIAIDIINQASWVSLDLNMIRDFQNIYNTFLSQFDGFIACHPNSFCLLYEKYNKPIYIINSCRYDMPFCWNKDKGMIRELNMCLKRLQDTNRLHFISNNFADNEYFKLANLNINTQIIPSLCLYTHVKWIPSSIPQYFLLYSGVIPEHYNVINKTQLGKGYSWETLMKFKGIIHIPYEASTMSIFEQISCGIPLFFPTKNFLYKLWSSGEQHCGVNYWVNPPEYLHITNDYKFWIERADYYSIEGAYYFNSFEELFNMIDSFEDIHYQKRFDFIEKRKNKVLKTYKNLLITL